MNNESELRALLRETSDALKAGSEGAFCKHCGGTAWQHEGNEHAPVVHHAGCIFVRTAEALTPPLS